MLREGNGTPLQYSCLENPMDGGAWWAAVYVDHNFSFMEQASFNFMAEVTVCSDFGAPQKLSLSLFPLFSHLFAIK